MSENMKLWDEVKTPPKEALKEIKAGRLKGKSDISPQWRIQVMTEQFGPCGIGWKFTIDRKWTEPGSEGQLMCFADVSLYIPREFGWSDPIPGTGGNMLVTKESKGLHTSDEGYKMAVTDALGVAMKTIGVAADVYLGKDFESKYNKKPRSDKTLENKTDPVWKKLGDAKKMVGTDIFNKAKKEAGLTEVYKLTDAGALLAIVNRLASEE